MTGEELKQSRRLLFMLFVAWGVGFIDVQAVNIESVPMRSELGLSTIQVGMAVSGYFAYRANRYGGANRCALDDSFN